MPSRVEAYSFPGYLLCLLHLVKYIFVIEYQLFGWVDANAINCSENEEVFSCLDGSCLFKNMTCNGFPECKNAEDELFDECVPATFAGFTRKVYCEKFAERRRQLEEELNKRLSVPMVIQTMLDSEAAWKAVAEFTTQIMELKLRYMKKE